MNFIQTGWSDNFKVPEENVWPTEGSVYSAFLVAAIKITDGLLHEVASCQLASKIIIKTFFHQSTLCVDAWHTLLYWWGLFWFSVIVLSTVCLFNEEKRLFYSVILLVKLGFGPNICAEHTLIG